MTCFLLNLDAEREKSAVSDLPARYIDPETNARFANVADYKEIRRRVADGRGASIARRAGPSKVIRIPKPPGWQPGPKTRAQKVRRGYFKSVLLKLYPKATYARKRTKPPGPASVRVPIHTGNKRKLNESFDNEQNKRPAYDRFGDGVPSPLPPPGAPPMPRARGGPVPMPLPGAPWRQPPPPSMPGVPKKSNASRRKKQSETDTEERDILRAIKKTRLFDSDGKAYTFSKVPTDSMVSFMLAYDIAFPRHEKLREQYAPAKLFAAHAPPPKRSRRKSGARGTRSSGASSRSKRGKAQTNGTGGGAVSSETPSEATPAAAKRKPARRKSQQTNGVGGAHAPSNNNSSTPPHGVSKPSVSSNGVMGGVPHSSASPPPVNSEAQSAATSPMPSPNALQAKVDALWAAEAKNMDDSAREKILKHRQHMSQKHKQAQQALVQKHRAEMQHFHNQARTMLQGAFQSVSSTFGASLFIVSFLYLK